MLKFFLVNYMKFSEKECIVRYLKIGKTEHNVNNIEGWPCLGSVKGPVENAEKSSEHTPIIQGWLDKTENSVSSSTKAVDAWKGKKLSGFKCTYCDI